ncbi:hypothetical protein PRZ48_006034 [Zasmidium cellare]|uniref:Deoxyribonuclease NucA/NucB domain-containing protein n=1 Tax=Zasmidium cellare TaxID=395010 RepID=A0ABR0EN19_ZASCE|nr:hypothetical protein PRZ48_006034 [Zasmidium cellare]
MSARCPFTRLIKKAENDGQNAKNQSTTIKQFSKMLYTQSLVLLGLLGSVQQVTSFATFGVSCALYPGPCNNNCYAIFVADKSHNLNWDKPDRKTKDQRRKDAGCEPNPCKNGKIKKPSNEENSCDEYPYASTVEGGPDSIIRCTEEDENLNEGSALGGFLTSNDGCGGEQCTFTVMNTKASKDTPYCLDEGGANDGFEYRKKNGNYIQAKRGKLDLCCTDRIPSNLHQDEEGNVYHERHVPDPAVYFPLDKRREFLLDNGETGLLMSRDLETSYEGHKIVTGHPNGTVSTARVVRELHGMEKSPALRPSHLKSRIAGA